MLYSYKEKSASDLQSFTHHLHTLLEHHNLSPSHISSADIAYFVKNVRSLRVIRTRALEEEYDQQKHGLLTESINEIIEEASYAMEAEEEDNEADGTDDSEEVVKPFKPDNIHWYFSFRSLEAFVSTHNRYPGISADESELVADVEALSNIQSELLKSAQIETEVVKECLIEL